MISQSCLPFSLLINPSITWNSTTEFPTFDSLLKRSIYRLSSLTSSSRSANESFEKVRVNLEEILISTGRANFLGSKRMRDLSESSFKSYCSLVVGPIYLIYPVGMISLQAPPTDNGVLI